MVVLVPVLVVALALAAGVLLTVARRPDADPGVPRWPGPRDPDAPADPTDAPARPRRSRLARATGPRFDPEAAPGLALTGAAAGLVTVGVILAMVQTRLGLAHFDLGAAEWAAARGSTAGTGVLRALTHLGSTAGVVALAAVVLLVERRRVPLRPAAGLLVLVLGGQWLAANLIKVLVDRARPDLAPLVDPFGSSFPSGHATAAAAAFAGFALLLGRGRSRRTRALLAAAAAGLAGAVATSRVLLGVHWLTDVVAGLALGWAWFALCAMAVGGRRLDLGDPVERRTAAAPRARDRQA
jgi:membrane-associated phospholipid phosphatase